MDYDHLAGLLKLEGRMRAVLLPQARAASAAGR